MIQNLSTLVSQVELINLSLEEGAFVQKIQSTPTTFCIRARIPGDSLFIHIGRGRGVEGLWLEEAAPEKEYRVKDRFDDWLKKNLIGLRINKMTCDKEQRIIHIDLTSKDKKYLFSLFYKGRALNFSFISNEESFRSWVGKKEEGYDVLPNTSTEVFRELYSGPKAKTGEVKTYDLLEHYKSLVVKKSNSKKKKTLTKKITLLKTQLNYIDQAKELQGKLYGLGPQDIELAYKKIELKIKVKTGETEHQFRDRAFQKIKNLKNSKQYKEDKIRNLEEEVKASHDFFSLKKTNQPNWAEIKGRKVKNNSILSFTILGRKGLLGRNVKGNDYARNTFGSKSDTWFHLDKEKSCHVVLKMSKEEVTQEVADLIGSLIRDEMKKSSLELRLVYSSLSEIRGIRGRSGSVTISNPNYFKVLYNQNWKEIISVD